MTYKLSDVVYEQGEYWVLRVPSGFEVYRTGITHSTRCAQIGYVGNEGIAKAVIEIDRRERRYHIVAINMRTEAKTYMTKTPVEHHEACTMMHKISNHAARRIQLEEAPL